MKKHGKKSDDPHIALLEQEIEYLRSRVGTRQADLAQEKYVRGDLLHQYRKEARMTADELVCRLAVTTKGKMDFTSSAVYAWERGRNLLQDHVILKIAPILGRSLQDFGLYEYTQPLQHESSGFPPAQDPVPDSLRSIALISYEAIRREGLSALDGRTMSDANQMALWDSAHWDPDKIFANPEGGPSAWLWD